MTDEEFFRAYSKAWDAEHCPRDQAQAQHAIDTWHKDDLVHLLVCYEARLDNLRRARCYHETT